LSRNSPTRRRNTPGHVGVSITSGTQSLLFTGDLFIVPAQIAHPEWASIFDLDPQAFVATRRRFLERAAADRSIVFNYHFAEIGQIRRNGIRFDWEPLR
jgi:glyoxylase-like metal-dependent hydrolase (beta-lactamase superfamily II)